MSTPYPFRDYEDRIGIGHLDELHARRRELIAQVAPLRALHGSFGKFDALRKQKLGAFAEVVRAQYAEKGIKITESRIDQLAHCYGGYVVWLTDMMNEHAEMINLDNEIRDIDEQIVRETAITGWSRTEAGMTK